jgi:hypothetical protein
MHTDKNRFLCYPCSSVVICERVKAGWNFRIDSDESSISSTELALAIINSIVEV